MRHAVRTFALAFVVPALAVAPDAGAGMEKRIGGSVNAIAYSPDGTLLATVGQDGFARLWDAASGREIRKIPAQRVTVQELPGGGTSTTSGYLTSVAFSPDGKTLATGSSDRIAGLWEVASGKELRRLEGHDADSGIVRAVAFSPDGKTLATAAEDRTVRLWDVSSGTSTRTLAGHGSRATSVAFSPDGKRLVSGSEDKTARIWDLQAGGEPTVLGGHEAVVYAVAFSPDGRMVATGSVDPERRDNAVRLFDAGSGQMIRRMPVVSRLPWKGGPEPGDGVSSLAFSRDGGTLVSGGGFQVTLWNPATGEEVRPLVHAVEAGIHDFLAGLAISPDGERIATAWGDPTVRVFNAAAAGPPALSFQADWAEVWEETVDPEKTVERSGGGP